MKKSVTIIVVLVTIGSLLLSSCGAFEGYGRTKVTWFVGLGAGWLPDQIKVERSVVDEFNKSQDKIWLVLDVAPSSHTAFDIIKSNMASGRAPDVVGPVGWSGANFLNGQWLDMAPYIKESNYDTSVFNPNLVKFYQTKEGDVGLPFAVYPAMVFYNKGMFDQAQLAYPPKNYGEKYILPDDTKVEWSWDTLTYVAKLLTLDRDGRNATQNGFDSKNIVQYGYYPQFQSFAEIGSFWGAGQPYETRDGTFIPHIPKQWEAAWEWYFNGMWGREPFIPIGTIAHDGNKSNGNPFSYGIVAMAVTQLWYPSCCLSLPDGRWDMAALPSYQGSVHGNVHADTFRILKSSQNPTAAFEVLKYLLGTASPKLLEAYNGMPGLTANQEAFLSAQKKKFPSVMNWSVVQAGLSYPAIPTAEQYLPNGPEAYLRITSFGQLLETQSLADFDSEIGKLKADLQTIFNKK
jgi:multiple sugar transport system substrate-binding protein